MLLLSAINANESVKGIKFYKAACDVAEKIDLHPPLGEDGKVEQAELIEWLKEDYLEIEFTETQRDMVKSVLLKCAEQGVLPKTRYMGSLIANFGLDS